MPPRPLVLILEFKVIPGHVLVKTNTFEEHHGQTTVSSTSIFESFEDRDGMLESEMASGAIEAWERLAELLEHPQKSKQPYFDVETTPSSTPRP